MRLNQGDRKRVMSDWLMSASGRGCVKTRSSQGCTELFSQLPSSDRSCQRNWLPYRRNRDGNSTRKFNVRVFTQPRSISEVGARYCEVCFAPMTGHREPGHACPKGANNGSQADYSITSSARASSVAGISTPSVLAVLRLITSSNFVGCITGKSAGLAPFKIWPA
jgi:hypothetical protein